MGIYKTKRNSNLRKWIEKLSFEIIKTGATFIIKMTWMEGSMIYIYIQIYHVTNDMTRLYHITYNQYETNMTLLTKKGHMCFILKIARTRRIRNPPSFFFLNTVQFAQTFCFTWLTWFTPRRIHTIGGKPAVGHFGWDFGHSKMNNFFKNGQFLHSNVKLLVLISNLPFHSDWLRLWCLWQMSGFIRGYHQKNCNGCRLFLFPWLNYCSITLWAQNIGECWSQYHSWPLSIPIFAEYSIAHNNVFSFVYMAASQAASSTL